MIRAYASEWQKLIRRGMFMAAAGLIGAGIIGAVIGVTRAQSSGLGEYNLTRLAQSDGFFQIMVRAGDLVALASLGIIASGVAWEYQHGTLRNLLVRQPDRLGLLAGKVLALLTWLGAAVVVAVSASLAAALVAARFRGLDTSAWFSSSGLVSIFDAYGDVVLQAIGFGVVGAALAVVLRSVAPAIVGSFLWLLPGEALLVVAFNQLGPWLPGRALGAIGAGGTDVLPYTRALLVAGVWLAGLTVVAAVAFRQRDVTS